MDKTISSTSKEYKTGWDWYIFFYGMLLILSVTGHLKIHPVWILMPLFTFGFYHILYLLGAIIALLGPVGLLILFILQFLIRNVTI